MRVTPFYGDHESFVKGVSSTSCGISTSILITCQELLNSLNVKPRELGNDTNCGCSMWTCPLVGLNLPSSLETLLSWRSLYPAIAMSSIVSCDGDATIQDVKLGYIDRGLASHRVEPKLRTLALTHGEQDSLGRGPLIVSVKGITVFSSDLLRCLMQLHQLLRRNFDRPANPISPLPYRRPLASWIIRTQAAAFRENRERVRH